LEQYFIHMLHNNLTNPLNPTNPTNPTNPMTISVEKNPGEEWDNFVCHHPQGTIYHTTNWMNVIEQSFKHISVQIITIRNDQNKIVAGLPIYLVDSWITGRRLVSAPFASIFDPLINNETEMDTILNMAKNMFKENRCHYLEIRTLQNSHFIDNKPFLRLNSYKYHYLKLVEPDKLKKTFSRTSVRQPIKRSLKYGLLIKMGQNEAALKTFYKIYTGTRKYLGLPVQPFEFFKNLFDSLSPMNAISLFLAQKDGDTIAALIAFKYKNRFSLEYSGYNPNYLKLYPNHFLYWHAIMLAYNEGYKIFDFGRTAVSNHGLMFFKKRWGTKVEDLPNFYYPSSYAIKKNCNRESSLQYKLVRKVLRHSPMIVSKIISGLIYKHLG